MQPLRLQFEISFDAGAVKTLSELLSLTIEAGADQLVQTVMDAVQASASKDKPKSKIELSQHALFGGQKPPADQGLLIDTKQVSKLLNVSARTIWAMQNDGRMPKPMHIGRAVRWSYNRIKEWVDAGCPSQQ